MNKVQEKILEAVGVLSKNRCSITSFSKENIFSTKERFSKIKNPSYVCAKNKDCLVLAESWFRERGIYLSWGSLGTIFFTGMFFFASYFLVHYNGLLSFSIFLTLFFSFIILFFSGYPLFFAAQSELKVQGAQYTVFNADSKKIHFVSDIDFQPKTCSWDEITFCIAYSAGSVEGYYYELRGYLLNEDGSVRDSFSFDDYHYMTSNSEQNRQLMVEDLTARFEYVRRFMEDGADSVEDVTGHLDLKPSLSESAHRFQPRSRASDGKKIHIIYSIARAIFLIPFSVQVVGHYFFCRYCRLPEWPQSVIDECGKEVFPRR